MTGSGWEALRDFREWAVDPCRMSWSGREAILDVREGSGSSKRFAGVVDRTSRMSGS